MAISLISYPLTNLVSEQIQPASFLDASGLSGSASQVLSAGAGGSLVWVTLPEPPETPSLQEVVNAGNTITDNTSLQWSLAGETTSLTNQNLSMAGNNTIIGLTTIGLVMANSTDTTQANLTTSGLVMENSTDTKQATLNPTSLNFADLTGNLIITQTLSKLTLNTEEQEPIDASFSKYWPVVINGTSYIVPLFIPTV